AKMRRSCLYPYSSTALMSVMATLLSVTFTFCVERDFSQWKLDWNVRLLIVAYAGIVVSEVMVAMISWCIRMRGLLAALPQNLHMEALALTSEIFVATISYLIPAITFILSLSFRGVKVKMLSFHINLFNQRNGGGAVHSSHSGGRLFLVGAMLAFFNNASYALWPIIQAKGIVVSGVMVAVISWCVRMRGPLFFSVFSPLMLVGNIASELTYRSACFN
ncbi:hypothetical protein S245_014451, partial [Arachis hypogaea]